MEGLSSYLHYLVYRKTDYFRQLLHFSSFTISSEDGCISFRNAIFSVPYFLKLKQKLKSFDSEKHLTNIPSFISTKLTKTVSTSATKVVRRAKQCLPSLNGRRDVIRR